MKIESNENHKPKGRPRTLNNPLVPKDHICGKCKEDNTKVGFKIQNGKPSQWCNTCLNGMNIPLHKRRENIADRINEYQGVKNG